MTARRRTLILLAALAVFFLIAAVPWTPSGPIRRATGLVAATLVLWIGEVAPLGVVALFIPMAAVFAGLLEWPEAIAGWGDSVVFLFLGAFLLARALDKFGAFDWLLGLLAAPPDERGRGGPLAITLGLSGLLSTVQNNTAVAAMLLPIVAAVARRTASPAALMVALSWGSTFGGMATPVGTAPNFIGYAAMRKLDASVSFLSWLKVGVPVWLGATAIGWAVLRLAARWRPPPTETAGWIDDFVQTDVGPTPARPSAVIDHEEGRTGRAWALAALATAAAIWLGCGFVVGLTPETDPLHGWVRTYLPESLVPVAAAGALFFVRAGRSGRTVLDRRDFQALDWDTLFLIAGGLTLGRVLDVSGAAAALATAVSATQADPMLLMLLLAGVTVMLSELTSNTATASLMVPLAGALGPALGVGPVSAIWLVALAASLGFALPVSTPPNALVYGTRLVPLRFMVVTGVVLDVLCVGWLVLCVRLLA